MSTHTQPGAPRDEGLPAEARLQALLIMPAGEPADPGVPASRAVRARQPSGVSAGEPDRPVGAEVLEECGLRAARSDADMRVVPGDKGLFIPLEHLGATIALIPSEDDTRRRITDGSNDKLLVVPDFPLTFPRPVFAEAEEELVSASAIPSDVWSEASGIHRAHGEKNKGAGVLYGMLDTGIDADHHEFVKRRIEFAYVPLRPRQRGMRNVRGFDTQGHGTHVAGIIAGAHIGIAPKARLLVGAVIESEVITTSMQRTLYGLDWLLGRFSKGKNRRKPAILNMSLGFPQEPPAGADASSYRLWDLALRKAVQTVADANVLIVAAIGNEGPGTCRFPGRYPEVIGVGSVDSDLEVSEFSGDGGNDLRKPDIFGFGEGVFSSLERNGDGDSLYVRKDGTSFAAPYVAGIAGLYWSGNAHLTAAQVRQILFERVSPLASAQSAAGGRGLACYDPVSI